MDLPEEKCSESKNDPDTTGCITRFIEKKAGCTLPVQGSDINNVTKCENARNIHKFLEMNREFDSEIKLCTDIITDTSLNTTG